MRKRILTIFGRRLVLCWVPDQDNTEETAKGVVETLPDPVGYWGGFGVKSFMLIMELPA